jgi:DNA invertase Pin-like site-specific DNA recombinase
MKGAVGSKSVRCAVYTRVSTDSGLDQEFNSLDAQYDASQAYIRSQAHAGWALVRSRYDDGGFSGGSTARPALQRLLDDIRAHRVNVIVVYKVDRLTRSLADFAKLVELFDAHGVSFVSVTQQFNTTTSMGRLTLNVLLSFAQFEREVTSERIRDKIGASKRKGLWVGGVVPLGYHARDRKITIVDHEARVVRHVFQRYLELGSLNALLADLRSSGIKTKIRPLASRRTIGGIPFTRGSLVYLLRNRFYIGEVRYKGEIFKGEQPTILDSALFEAVQSKLEAQRTNHTIARHSSEAMLMGLIFDGRGNRMTPTYAIKKGVRYRYYVSSNLNQGDKASAAALNRVPAIEIETLVLAAIKEKLGSKQQAGIAHPESPCSDGELVRMQVARIVIRTDEVVVTLCDRQLNAHQAAGQPKRSSPNRTARKIVAIKIPWRKRPSKLPREIIRPVDSENSDRRPIRSETRATLVKAIANGRRWLEDLVTGRVISADQIALRKQCSVRQVNRVITLAFLAPDLVQAAFEGRLPRGIGVEALRDCPAEWRQQRQMLGLA